MGLSPKLQTSYSSDENLVLAQNPSLNNHFWQIFPNSDMMSLGEQLKFWWQLVFQL